TERSEGGLIGPFFGGSGLGHGGNQVQDCSGCADYKVVSTLFYFPRYPRELGAHVSFEPLVLLFGYRIGRNELLGEPNCSKFRRPQQLRLNAVSYNELG